MRAAFSERTFEFCFSAEFCRKYCGFLITHPILPSQAQEKALGYDVRYLIDKGIFCYSIFLQNKVPFYASTRQHNNLQFYDCHNGAYYRFTVDNEQHNNLMNNIGECYYCAPLFHTWDSINYMYATSTITNNSIWIKPTFRIIDNLKHNITYDINGRNAFLHSEPKELSIRQPDDFDEIKAVYVNDDFIRELANKLKEIVDNKKIDKDKLSKLDHLGQVQYIIGQILRTTWILIPM